MKHYTCKDHAKDAPTGYLAWDAWAHKKSRTHRQVRCSECKRFAIWIPKVKRAKKP